MFRSLCNTLIRNKILKGGDSKPLSLQNPYFLLHIKVRFFSSSSIDHNYPSSSSFVVSYLMNFCGLTEEQALSASKKLINFKTTFNLDTVLTLLEAHGFTKSHISKVITKVPKILSYDTLKTLKPKFDYFNSKDISRLELVNVLSTNPDILCRSLENNIIPFFDFIKNIVGTDRHTFVVFRLSRFSVAQIEKVMLNIQVLRDEGVPQSNIVKFLINQPTSLMINTVKFKDIVQEIKGMGFDPYKTAFLSAIQAITAMTKSTWETKLNAYRKWGWSEDQIQNAFMLHSQCMKYSEKKISMTMDYLVNQMGISSLLIVRCPMILSFSLEKTILPRVSVHQILTAKGLIKDKISLYTTLRMSKKSFLEKFVIKYEQEAPELLKVKELS